MASLTLLTADLVSRICPFFIPLAFELTAASTWNLSLSLRQTTTLILLVPKSIPVYISLLADSIAQLLFPYSINGGIL